MGGVRVVLGDYGNAVVIVVVCASDVGAVTILEFDLETVAFLLGFVDGVEVGEGAV